MKQPISPVTLILVVIVVIAVIAGIFVIAANGNQANQKANTGQVGFHRVSQQSFRSEWVVQMQHPHRPVPERPQASKNCLRSDTEIHRESYKVSQSHRMNKRVGIAAMML